MARVRFSICLPEKEHDLLNTIKDKYYQGKRSPALVDAVKLLAKMYLRGRIADSRRLAAILAEDDDKKEGKKKK